MTSYYKLTTHDGWDLFTGSTVNYRAACGTGVPLHCPTEPSSSGPALCQPGVLHASLTPRATFSGLDRERQGLDRLALWEVVGDPVVDDGRTVGFRALLVVRELPLIATVWGAGYHERIAWVHDELIPAVREIPWLRPPSAPVYEHLEALATEHLLALSEWGDTGPLPLRVVSGRADAAVAAADAADAADAVAAGDVAAGDVAADAAIYATVGAAADAAVAAADAADAAADAAAVAAGLFGRLRWYVYPGYAIRRCARWHLRGEERANPWLPLVEMWSLGVLPIGVVGGEYVVYVPGGCASDGEDHA